jgi:nicotinic acid mononucleotide adenylyltransferase
MRAVSLENAKRMAEKNLWLAEDYQQEYKSAKFFGLAITGAHYEDRASHIWVYLVTQNWNAYMHFEVIASPDRVFVGSMVSDRVQWFTSACLLGTQTWREHIEDIGDSLDLNNIDVLYAPGVSDAERMLLLRPHNPLVYKDGKFRRVKDILRENTRIYPGAFNPPTKTHLSVDALFEISQTHEYKGVSSIQDILHRVYMLDLESKSVLITQAPRFVDKYRLLENGEYNFVLGTDLWNAMIAHHQYPTETWLAEQMPNANFIIRPRPGVEMQESIVSRHLRYQVQDEKQKDVSSTKVRTSGDHSHLTSAVSEYIKSRGLYSAC